MKALAHILFQVGAGDADPGDGPVELKIDIAVEGRGLVVLGDLVILRGVGIEIVLPIELGVAGNGAVQKKAGEGGQSQRFFVGHGQHPGQAEADRTDVRVGRRAKLVGAAAPHLGPGLQLNVGLQADDRFVFHAATILVTDQRG